MRIIPRTEWTDRKVRLSSMTTPTPDTWVHHTGDNGPSGGSRATLTAEKSYMRAVEAYHINSRGFAAVAYSFIIMPSGRIFVGRGWGKAGGHTYGKNTTSHGFCLAGNFMTQRPTKAALRALGELVDRGIDRGHIRKPRRRHPSGGHRDVDVTGTVCPGDHLYRQLRDLRRTA